MGNDLENANNIIQGELVVGNHDSLLVFGNDAQIGLNEFSKSVSNIITKNNNELEVIIADLSEQLEKSNGKEFTKTGLDIFKSESKYIRDVLRRYNKILTNVDQVELSLKLQQVQLIKDTKMLDYLAENLETSIAQIEKYVTYGKKVSGEKKLRSEEIISYELDSWYNRLDKKIQDLEISHTIAMQNIAQIRLMKENNYLLIDKIVSIIGTTIPIWRNQISLILGIEKMRYNTEIQEKVLDMTAKQIEKSQSFINKSERRKKKIDWQSLQGTNQQLIDVLQELKGFEQEDKTIKSNMTNIILQH